MLILVDAKKKFLIERSEVLRWLLLRNEKIFIMGLRDVNIYSYYDYERKDIVNGFQSSYMVTMITERKNIYIMGSEVQ